MEDDEKVGDPLAEMLVIGLLWFVAIGFMFFAQHHVCDAYFVPAINVFVSTMRKSKSKFLQRWGEEAVAGATICALGCNGPELFTNLISLYTASDAGIGVVVGSEIFNLLIIVGAATICAPVLPLELERVPFTRDCIFYGLSICLLYMFLQDKQIESWEALSLLAAAVVYVMAVYFTTDVVNCIWKQPKPIEGPSAESLLPKEPKKGKMHGITVGVEQILHSRMADGHNAGAKTTFTTTGTQEGFEPEGPSKAAMRGSIGIQMPDKKHEPMTLYKNLVEVEKMEHDRQLRLEFETTFMHVTLLVSVESQEDFNNLLKRIQEKNADSIKAFNRPFIHEYDPTVKGAIAHFRHTLSSDPKLSNKLFAIPEFLIDFLLKGTLFAVDVKDKSKERRWPLCFAGAMFWLAVFSYLMLEVAVQIHKNIPGLPNSFLGITVCAIGTSFPNAVASVLMAQQNQPAAAIANALGSNVQNVFLAMALPWVIFTCISRNDGAALGEPIPQNVQGITEGVYWMMGTLLLVVLFVLLPPFCKINGCYGYVLAFVYLVYLVITSGEVFHAWPPMKEW